MYMVQFMDSPKYILIPGTVSDGEWEEKKKRAEAEFVKIMQKGGRKVGKETGVTPIPADKWNEPVIKLLTNKPRGRKAL